jgi:hypothetical protein
MWRVPISVGLWILRGPIRIGLAVGAQSNWAIGPWVSISIGPKPNFFSFDRSVLTFLHFDRMVFFLFSSAQLSILSSLLFHFSLPAQTSLFFYFFLAISLFSGSGLYPCCSHFHFFHSFLLFSSSPAGFFLIFSFFSDCCAGVCEVADPSWAWY